MSQKNEELKSEYCEATYQLDLKKDEWNEKLSALDNKNHDNIEARSSLRLQRYNKESSRKGRIWTGIIIAIAGVGAYYYYDKPMLLAGGLILGLLFVILGVSCSSSIQKLSEEINKYNVMLNDYDAEAESIRGEIRKIDSEIARYDEKFQKILLEEKYAEVDKWIQSISKGHAVLFVSGEAIGSASPRTPANGKSNDSYVFSNDYPVGEVYVNDMVYGKVKKEYGGLQLGIFEVDEQGTQKTQFAVQYSVHGNTKAYITEPIPVKYDQKSKFCWIHVQVSKSLSRESFGHKIYEYMFDDFTEFLIKTKITKDDIIKKYL